jgi:hypothetical protein
MWSFCNGSFVIKHRGSWASAATAADDTFILSTLIFFNSLKKSTSFSNLYT